MAATGERAKSGHWTSLRICFPKNSTRMKMQSHRIDRRRFLGSTSALAAICASRWSRADDLPQVVNPRATSGDQRFEPDWKKRLTITVGPEKADVAGSTDKAIQAAVDYVARLGGGSVKVLPGVYRCRRQCLRQLQGHRRNRRNLDLVGAADHAGDGEGQSERD